jgi:hypothetical protein
MMLSNATTLITFNQFLKKLNDTNIGKIGCYYNLLLSCDLFMTQALLFTFDNKMLNNRYREVNLI